MVTNFMRILIRRPFDLAVSTIHMVVRKVDQLQAMVLNGVLFRTLCRLLVFGVVIIPLCMARTVLFTWEYLVAKHLLFVHNIRRTIRNAVVVQVVRPLDEDEISLIQGDTAHIRMKRKHHNTRASVSQILDEDMDEDTNSLQLPQEIEHSLDTETKRNCDVDSTNQEEEKAQDVNNDEVPIEECMQNSPSQRENEGTQDVEVRELPIAPSSSSTPEDKETSPCQCEGDSTEDVGGPELSSEPEVSRGLNESSSVTTSEYETALTSPLPPIVEDQVFVETHMHEERRPTESHL